MFPMVSEVAEFEAARALLDRELAQAESQGVAMPASVKVGVMLEVPALCFQLPALLARVDFLSVGSNDLLQFMFASDRGNPMVGERYDNLAPAVLTMLREVVGKCREAEVPLSLCGEMAGQPLEAMALIGLGFRSLSMRAGAIGSIRLMTRSLDVGALGRYMETITDGADHSLRNKLLAFARDHNISI